MQEQTLGNRLKPLGAFIAAIALFFIAWRLPVIGGVLRGIEASCAQAGSAVSLAVARFFESENSLSLKLTACTEDKAALARDVVEYETLKKENAELKEELGYQTSAASRAIAAHVLARALPEDATRMVIDRGSADGIAQGSTVVVGQGIMLGTISHTDEHTSVVTLVTAVESKIPAAIIGKKRTIGLAEGKTGAVMDMGFIPRDADIARGDVVVTSGLDGVVPEGLLLGTVTEVIDLASAPFKQSLVEPFADPLQWSSVLVLPPMNAPI